MYPKVTIIYDYGDGDMDKFPGFLVDPEHVIYVTPKCGNLYLAQVTPSKKHGIYNYETGLILGIVVEGEEESVVSSLMKSLKTRSAYDFLKNVMMNVPEDIEYDELIIPGFINSH